MTGIPTLRHFGCQQCGKVTPVLLGAPQLRCACGCQQGFREVDLTRKHATEAPASNVVSLFGNRAQPQSPTPRDEYHHALHILLRSFYAWLQTNPDPADIEIAVGGSINAIAQLAVLHRDGCGDAGR